MPQANLTLALALTFIPTFNIRNKLPHTKDVYDFVRRLKDEDEYQHYKSKESQVQIKKRKKNATIK